MKYLAIQQLKALLTFFHSIFLSCPTNSFLFCPDPAKAAQAKFNFQTFG